jgi:hypothetical protein
MKTLFIGIVAVALLAMFVAARADTFPVEAGPGNLPPEIYLIHSQYDICADAQWGGSRPYIPVNGIQDAQSDGCIVAFDEIRADEYAFTGEQIYFLVVVRDLNGAPDIGYAYFTVDGQHEALCQDITAAAAEAPGTWGDQIPAKPFAPKGFQPATDKIFNCILTVEPSWYGESMISIEANDQAGAVTDNGIAQTWFFNPAIIVDLSTNDGAPSIEFENGYPGQTVMSTNKLIVTNLAEGGVDLWAFIAADDLTDPTHSGAMCPISNVLDVNPNMEFRCKIGTLEDDGWNCITNKDTGQDCVVGHCLGALPLLEGYAIQGFPAGDYSIIKNQGSAECQFRLTYPVPCIGTFTEGAYHVIVRAV